MIAIARFVSNIIVARTKRFGAQRTSNPSGSFILVSDLAEFETRVERQGFFEYVLPIKDTRTLITLIMNGITL